jgi:hypothetical protein
MIKLSNFGIKTFYRYFIQNSKTIIIFLIVLIIHFVFIVNLQEKALVVEEILELRKTHQITQEKIAVNLMGDCSIFKNLKIKETLLENMTKLSGYKFYLVKEKVIALDSLNFYEILYKTYKPSDSDIFTKSSGYMVESSESKKCFGVI